MSALDAIGKRLLSCGLLRALPLCSKPPHSRKACATPSSSTNVMALPSRLGAFMVGAALGSAQCFYWLYKDVQNVSAAMTRKLESVKQEVSCAVFSVAVSTAKAETPNIICGNATPATISNIILHCVSHSSQKKIAWQG